MKLLSITNRRRPHAIPYSAIGRIMPASGEADDPFPCTWIAFNDGSLSVLVKARYEVVLHALRTAHEVNIIDGDLDVVTHAPKEAP